MKNEFLKEIGRLNSYRKELTIGFENSALLVIDMQKFFCDKESHAYIKNVEKIIPNINTILELFRKKGRPVVFTYHAYQRGENQGIMAKWWNDNIIEDNPDSSIKDILSILSQML